MLKVIECSQIKASHSALIPPASTGRPAAF
uniref:Uncharacterized protein n=1 Tax=Anguilla anguilla TaxID=7936 RepID=A0A0E9S1R0_ANGAN